MVRLSSYTSTTGSRYRLTSSVSILMSARTMCFICFWVSRGLGGFTRTRLHGVAGAPCRLRKLPGSFLLTVSATSRQRRDRGGSSGDEGA